MVKGIYSVFGDVKTFFVHSTLHNFGVPFRIEASEHDGRRRAIVLLKRKHSVMNLDKNNDFTGRRAVLKLTKLH